jgi:HlyD family secretion protein
MYDQQVIAAQAGVDGAELQQAGAQSALNKLWAMRNHPVALDAAVHRAQGQVLQASAGITLAITSLAQVQARVQPEAITLGQAKVTQAEASAALVKATIDKLSIRAPISGTVTAQVVHPGEVAQPGQTLLTLVDLSQVKLAVFVPAGQIGRVRLGQGAVVTVDAYPARAFSGVVSHINDQAEFTPKNVQTPEERARTVFRVEIALENPGGALKPGMPADAVLQ